MSDAQLALLWQDTNTSIWMIGKFFNSAPMMEVIGLFMGLILLCSLIAMIFRGIYGMLGFHSR